MITLLCVEKVTAVCDYDDSSTDNTLVCSSDCQCSCHESLTCTDGPPIRQNGVSTITLYDDQMLSGLK